MNRLAVFASGSGTNFQAIVDAIKNKSLNINVCLLICDKKDAFVIERAKVEGIDTFIFNAKDYKTKAEYEKDILEVLDKQGIDFIALAGYMRLIGNTLLDEYEGRIVNIHPSLLPAFKGKDAIGQAIKYGVKVMGVTIHYVDSGMDTGNIIAQESFRLIGNETKEQIEAQIHAIEHRLYPQTLKMLLENKEEVLG